MKVDVAIIGTGPAGGIAACQLAGTGLRVAILEAKELPRFKPCGGLMPGGVSSLMDWNISHLVKQRVTRLEYFNNFHQHQVNDLPNGELLLVNRASFDQGLIDRALEAGNGNISLHEGFKVAAVVETPDHVVISALGHPDVQADYLVAADGAVSKTARCLGLNANRLNGVTIDAEVTVTDACYERHRDRVVFNYFVLPHGYGWIFPKEKPVLSCGVGSWSGKSNVRAAITAYLKNSFNKNEILTTTQHGFPIPIYSGRAKISSKRVALAGDAASLVNPVSGEGIRFAMWSGKIAAETVHKLVLNDHSQSPQALDCSLYSEKVYSSMTRTLDHSLRFAALPFQQAPDLYYKHFIVENKGNPHYS
jgi:geranylgeranyl reductase family protein